MLLLHFHILIQNTIPKTRTSSSSILGTSIPTTNATYSDCGLDKIAMKLTVACVMISYRRFLKNCQGPFEVPQSILSHGI